MAIELDEVKFFDGLRQNLYRKIYREIFLREIWELRVKLDLSEMSWKSNRNKFGSVLSTKIIGASELDEVENFEFPKENLPKEYL